MQSPARAKHPGISGPQARACRPSHPPPVRGFFLVIGADRKIQAVAIGLRTSQSDRLQVRVNPMLLADRNCCGQQFTMLAEVAANPYGDAGQSQQELGESRVAPM